MKERTKILITVGIILLVVLIRVAFAFETNVIANVISNDIINDTPTAKPLGEASIEITATVVNCMALELCK